MIDPEVVIKVEGLGKSYAIQHKEGERYTALRDVLMEQAKSAIRVINPIALLTTPGNSQIQYKEKNGSNREEFWALKDVSFEVKRGERIGILGRNGAGKSTLLKILSRITEPTTGRVEICGRVASLLEVGTGFHPELTGRENIYLNGAILGMTRREIRTKFDEIVDFAEIERFLDTPVKRYSSGMYVRLAFAVAAHLEPEILVVDEVLAVGDASFQKKCLGKMEDVACREGRTILFVSHNVNAIRALCSKAIVLANGSTFYSGNISTALDAYLKNNITASNKRLVRYGEDAFEDSPVRLEAISVNDKTLEDLIHEEDLISISLIANFFIDVKRVRIDLLIYNNAGDVVVHGNSLINKISLSGGLGKFKLSFGIPPNVLKPDGYSIEITLYEHNKQVFLHLQDALFFEVVSSHPIYDFHPSSEWRSSLSPTLVSYEVVKY